MTCSFKNLIYRKSHNITFLPANTEIFVSVLAQHKIELPSSFWFTGVALWQIFSFCLCTRSNTGRLINLKVTLEESPRQKPIGLGQFRSYPCMLQIIKLAKAPHT